MTKKKEKSFEDEAREQSKKYLQAKNKIRLVKWLAKKDEELRSIQGEIEEMLKKCKKGDFSELPSISTKEEEKILPSIDWNLALDASNAGLPATQAYTVTTSTGTNLASIADKVIGN